tara:strand:- start:329 stop:574 length:246 start_codon:yes stop_codon:yes gene_type:complete
MFGIVSILAVWYTLTELIQLSSLAMTLAFMTLGLAAAGIVDNVLLKKHDTFQMLKNSPDGYSRVYMGYCIVIAAALIAGAG